MTPEAPKMAEDETFVSVITVEASSEKPVSEKSEINISIGDTTPDSSDSISIKIEHSDSHSTSSDSKSTISANSDQIGGVINEAFDNDEEQSKEKQKTHQRSPSCTVGKKQVVRLI